MPVNKGRKVPNTERHYQRASNHNKRRVRLKSKLLKDIIKEHQITTTATRGYTTTRLKDIIKEHQITTANLRDNIGYGLKDIIKEHQITTFMGAWRNSGKLKDIIKEHEFTTPARILMKCLCCIISVFVIYRKGSKRWNIPTF